VKEGTSLVNNPRTILGCGYKNNIEVLIHYKFASNKILIGNLLRGNIKAQTKKFKW
jgi:hypothetical protein